MDQLDLLVQGLLSAANPVALGIITAGVALGIVIGAMPGLGPTVGMAVSLPFILRFPSDLAIFLLMGIVIGAAFGNSITAIVLGIPGTPSALLSTLESKPLRRRGEELYAVNVALLSSTVAQTVAGLLFIMLVVPLAHVALRFLFPEIFALTVFALVTVIGMSRAHPAKGTIAAVVGFALGLVGPDPITSQVRYGFGVPELYTGLPVVAALIGLLAFREVFTAAATRGIIDHGDRGRRLEWPTLRRIREFKGQVGSTMLGTGVGAVAGALPGAGPTVGTFLTYGLLQFSRKIRPELGKGSIKAIAGIDAAQNSASTTALIPTLALGIPGSAPMVIVMALLASQGIFPGPGLVNSNPELLHAVFGGLMWACPILLVVGFIIIGPTVFVSKLSHPGVVSGSIILMIAGVYAIRWSLTDVWIALAVGVLGYLMSENGYPVAPAALALILGPILERNLRRGLVMTGNDVWEFVSRPVTAGLLLLSVVFFVVGRIQYRKFSEAATP